MTTAHRFSCPVCGDEWDLIGPLDEPRKECRECGAELEHEAEERP